MTYRRTRQLRKEADRKVDALLDRLYDEALSRRNTDGVSSCKDTEQENDNG